MIKNNSNNSFFNKYNKKERHFLSLKSFQINLLTEPLKKFDI